MLTRFDGECFQAIALHGVPSGFAEFWGQPRRSSPGLAHYRLTQGENVVQVDDITTEDLYISGNPFRRALGDLAGARTVLWVALRKDVVLLGSFVIYRKEVRSFPDKQIALLKNFATQAVIAIDNARLLNELRQRTDELTESLEQQTATSEVLRVISSSPADLEPVFATMLEKAVRICDATFGNVYRFDGKDLHSLAAHNTPPAFAAARKTWTGPPGPNNPLAQVIATKVMRHVLDEAASEAYQEGDPRVVAAVDLGGVRTILIVPMLKDDALVGLLTLARDQVRPFTEKQIELVTTFADQAVIAIENARLLNELRERTTDVTEALEQQTATSEVLKVISSSPADLQPVFDTMLANATRLCEATHGHVWTFDGEQMCAVSVLGDAPFVKWLLDHNPVRPIPGSAAERVVLGERVVHVADRREEPAYRDSETFRGLVDSSGIRASLSVALRKRG